MRTCGIAIALLLGLATTARAERPQFGARVVLGLANLERDDGHNEQTRRVVGAGGFTVVSIMKELELDAGIGYAQKGAVTPDQRPVDGGPSRVIAMNYIEIPALLAIRHTFASGRSMRFFAGPSLAYKVKATFGEFDEADVRPAVNYSVIGGVGFTFAAGRTTAYLDARFERGLSNVQNTDSMSLPITHRVFSLSLGFAL